MTPQAGQPVESPEEVIRMTVGELRHRQGAAIPEAELEALVRACYHDLRKEARFDQHLPALVYHLAVDRIAATRP